jgi:hypothetical protein
MAADDAGAVWIAVVEWHRCRANIAKLGRPLPPDTFQTPIVTRFSFPKKP